MRPRKTILLYCIDEDQRSWLSFFIENTRRYRVIGGISNQPPLPDAILIVDDRSLSTVTAARNIGDYHPDVAMFVMLARGHKLLAHGYPVWARSCKQDAKPAEILEALDIATARKRGPKGRVMSAEEKKKRSDGQKLAWARRVSA